MITFVLLLQVSVLSVGQASAPAGTADLQVDYAVQAGLRWLADQQAKDGSFGRTTQYRAYTAITALACLALVADGHLPLRGRQAETVRRGLNYVLAQADESGLIAEPGAAVAMYGHGYATLFLAEVFGETDQPDKVKRVLRRAVRLTMATQNAEGGWRYRPVRADADISVTVCQLWALRAVQEAGIAVPAQTVERAIRYVRDLQNADGGFRYQSPPGESGFSRSAAAVSVLQAVGVEDEAALRGGLDYLGQRLPRPGREVPYYFYGQYYAALAMYRAGGQPWERWWPAVREDLLARQDPSTGSWGDEYQTAMALLVLQTPKGLLAMTGEPGVSARSPGVSPKQ